MAYRYLGNKSKLSDWIAVEIGSRLPASSTIADPMCGTASVSEALARRGHNLIAADALKFPTLHAKARLLHNTAPAFSNFGGYENILHTINNLPLVEGYFFREFGEKGLPEARKAPRLYFSGPNAGKIDAIRSFLKKEFALGTISELERDLLIHDLILAVNAVANIAGTYGYFRSSISTNARVPLQLRPSSFVETTGSHLVYHGDATEVLSGLSVDAVYLDPPYTKRQYAGNYHILETLAREDEPIAQGDGGLRPWQNDASEFCYKRKAENAFRSVIESCDARFIFVSYSEDGQVSPEDLSAILREYGSLTICTQNHSRYRSNKNAKGGSVLEYLYCLEIGKK
ncbi:DNA adenine methylase [Corynebacterium sp. HMSC072B08]|uniref:DNA adenine methylase n=1 Tax=Corynebacterium sp. HMSC072B08 TaxID=1715136 RepID=UPI0009F192AE|nr:DNA adenine methylase [Corynebacterium sp. HMSC072B08]